jgi:hypothetical protein
MGILRGRNLPFSPFQGLSNRLARFAIPLGGRGYDYGPEVANNGELLSEVGTEVRFRAEKKRILGGLRKKSEELEEIPLAKAIKLTADNKPVQIVRTRFTPAGYALDDATWVTNHAQISKYLDVTDPYSSAPGGDGFVDDTRAFAAIQTTGVPTGDDGGPPNPRRLSGQYGYDLTRTKLNADNVLVPDLHAGSLSAADAGMLLREREAVAVVAHWSGWELKHGDDGQEIIEPKFMAPGQHELTWYKVIDPAGSLTPEQVRQSLHDVAVGLDTSHTQWRTELQDLEKQQEQLDEQREKLAEQVWAQRHEPFTGQPAGPAPAPAPAQSASPAPPPEAAAPVPPQAAAPVPPEAAAPVPPEAAAPVPPEAAAPVPPEAAAPVPPEAAAPVPPEAAAAAFSPRTAGAASPA